MRNGGSGEAPDERRTHCDRGHTSRRRTCCPLGRGAVARTGLRRARARRRPRPGDVALRARHRLGPVPLDAAPAGAHAGHPRLPPPGGVASLRAGPPAVPARGGILGAAQRRGARRTWRTSSRRSARRPTSRCSTGTRSPTWHRCRDGTRCGCSPRSGDGCSRTAPRSARRSSRARQTPTCAPCCRRTGLPRHTPHTLTDPEAFLTRARRIRQRGYALDEGEQEVGVRCVAVAVPGNTLRLALFVSGPAPPDQRRPAPRGRSGAPGRRRSWGRAAILASASRRSTRRQTSREGAMVARHTRGSTRAERPHLSPASARSRRAPSATGRCSSTTRTRRSPWTERHVHRRQPGGPAPERLLAGRAAQMAFTEISPPSTSGAPWPPSGTRFDRDPSSSRRPYTTATATGSR